MIENLKYKDFESYLPEFDFHNKQIQFFKDAFEIVTNNRDTNKVTVIPARCGIGKSIFIKTFMHSCIGDEYRRKHEVPHGLIVITDSIKRLEDLSNGEIESTKEYWGEAFVDWKDKVHYKDFLKNVIVLHSGAPFNEQLIEQQNKPIILMSTQRYFMLTPNIRDLLFKFKHNNELYPRDTVIFDERPLFSETISIDSFNFANVEAAFNEGLSEKVMHKKFILDEFGKFKNKMLKIMEDKEKISNDENVTLYWKDDEISTITSNDELLFSVVADNLNYLYKKYQYISRDLKCLKILVQNGAIFNSVKSKNGDYMRSFNIIKYNREYFKPGGDVKFFVFDATADIDPSYSVDYVEVLDNFKYDIPIKMKMINVDLSISKSSLRRTGNIRAMSKALYEYICKQTEAEHINKDRILIATYRDLYYQFTNKMSHVGYFGNLRGFNDYKDLSAMAHIGLNRFSHMAYFYIYCGLDENIQKELSEMSESESLQYFKNYNNPRNELFKLTEEIEIGCILTDLEQNIFRLSIRNYNNTKKATVWTFYNRESILLNKLSFMIADRYKKIGVEFEYKETPDEFKLLKIKTRKSSNNQTNTHPQIVIAWLEKQPTGRVFKVKELLSETGLSNKQFQKVKENNEVVGRMFEKIKTSKKGEYKIAA